MPRQEGWRRRFTFDLHIRMTIIRPVWPKIRAEPGRDPFVFRFFVLIRFNSFLLLVAFRPPARNPPPAGRDPLRFFVHFVYFRFNSFIFVYFRLFSFFSFSESAQNYQGGLVLYIYFLINLNYSYLLFDYGDSYISVS